jgi:hypothetical protein
MAQKKNNRRKKYTVGGIRKPRRVQKYYGGMPDVLYDDAGKPYILNPDGSKNYINTSGGTATPITGAGSKTGYVPRLDEFNPEDYATMTEAERLEQLMSRGQTEEEARANQASSLEKGYDINQDGVVSDQEFAALKDAQKTQRAGEAGFDPAKFTSEKRGSIGYDPSAGYTTKKPEPPTIKKREPIKYETLPSQPIPEEAILDESKVFIKEPEKEEEEPREGARRGGRRRAPVKENRKPPKTGGGRPSAPPKTGGSRKPAPPKRPIAKERPAPKAPPRPTERELMQTFQRVEEAPVSKKTSQPKKTVRPTKTPVKPPMPEPTTAGVKPSRNVAPPAPVIEDVPVMENPRQNVAPPATAQQMAHRFHQQEATHLQRRQC